jgi:hypothetical protein
MIRPSTKEALLFPSSTLSDKSFDISAPNPIIRVDETPFPALQEKGSISAKGCNGFHRFMPSFKDQAQHLLYIREDFETGLGRTLASLPRIPLDIPVMLAQVFTPFSHQAAEDMSNLLPKNLYLALI